MNFDCWFDYDESGSPVAMTLLKPGQETEYYYYIKNLQGDVIALADKNGDIYARYSYDAWGNIISIKNKDGVNITELSAADPAIANPFRYRSYFYDDFAKLYQLQSRYYDPGTGRFVNADGELNNDGSLLGTNLFNYCGNNPVMRVDPTGHFWKEIGNWCSNAWNDTTEWVSNAYNDVVNVAEQILGVAKNSIEIKAGGGYGVGVGVGNLIGAEAIAKRDLITVKYSGKDGFQLGSEEEENLCISAFTISVGPKKVEWHNFDCFGSDQCNCPGAGNDFELISQDPVIKIVDFKGYLIGGVNFSVGFNLDTFITGVVEIFYE